MKSKAKKILLELVKTKNSNIGNNTFNNFELKEKDLIKLSWGLLQFEKCTFLNIKFSDCDFSHTIFTNNIFKNCSFHHCSFSKTVFLNNDLTQCLFLKNTFDSCNLNELKLNSCSFNDVSFFQCSLKKNELSDTTFIDIFSIETDFSFSYFKVINLCKSFFQNSMFLDTVFDSSRIHKTQFNHCEFKSAKFMNSQFHKIDLRKNSNLSDEIVEAILKNDGTVQSPLKKYFLKKNSITFTLLILLSFLTGPGYVYFSPQFFISKNLWNEIFFLTYKSPPDKNDDFYISLQFLINPPPKEISDIFKEIISIRKSPQWPIFYNTIIKPEWLKGNIFTSISLSSFQKNEHQKEIMLWINLLNKQASIIEHCGKNVYYWILKETLTLDISDQNYKQIFNSVLGGLTSKDRELIHKKFILMSFKKNTYTNSIQVIESYINQYDPDITFYSDLIEKVSKLNYYPQLKFKKELKLMLLSIFKRKVDSKKNFSSLINKLSNEW